MFTIFDITKRATNYPVLFLRLFSMMTSVSCPSCRAVKTFLSIALHIAAYGFISTTMALANPDPFLAAILKSSMASSSRPSFLRSTPLWQRALEPALPLPSLRWIALSRSFKAESG